MLALFPLCHIQGRLIYIMTVVTANYTFSPNQGYITDNCFICIDIVGNNDQGSPTGAHQDLEWFLCVNLSIGPSHPVPFHLFDQDLISKRNQAAPKTKL